MAIKSAVLVRSSVPSYSRCSGEQLSSTPTLTNVRLPRTVCAVVGEVLCGSHATLDSFFLTAGAPGPPPESSTYYKVERLAVSCRQDPGVDSLAVLANVLEEFMDTEPKDLDTSIEWKANWERMVKVLEENGFRYYRGGRVPPSG